MAATPTPITWERSCAGSSVFAFIGNHKVTHLRVLGLYRVEAVIDGMPVWHCMTTADFAEVADYLGLEG